MRPVTVSSVVDAPRERVFDYLSDIANHLEFSDHFIDQFRLTRLDSRGVGAGARFRIASWLARIPGLAPFASIWAEIVITELERPHRILTEGAGGRIGRTSIRGEFLLTAHDHGMSRVTYTFSTDPATRGDRLREALGGRAWTRRQLARGLRRLRTILEQGRPSPHPPRVAAG
jgi:uncharacterized protein YndB with AHSA1/START domain